MPRIHASRSPEVSQRERDHMALSRSLAGECVVLLENNGALPLAGPGPVALYGNGARQTIRGGTGSGDVNTRSDVNLEQGLERAGFRITTKGWLNRQDAAHAQAKADYQKREQRIAAEEREKIPQVVLARPFQVIPPVEIRPEDLTLSETDTAIFVLSRTAGEGADRHAKKGDYFLYDEEEVALTLLGQTYPNVIVVLNIGGVMDLSGLKNIPGLSAVLLLGQLGNIGGEVLADVLLGKVNPSGKLTDTWAARYEDYPSSEHYSHNDGNLDDEYYREGIYVGYRYFDTFGVDPVYPFGYGLSYTTFETVPGVVTVENGNVKVTAAVTNTGACAGREVVQLYGSAPAGALPKPAQELRGFAKTGLIAPGASETVEICFPVKSLASYCEACAAWVLEAGEYILRVGNSSRSAKAAAVLTLNETVKVQILKNLFSDADPVQEIPAPVGEPAKADPALPRIAVAPASIETFRAVYQGERQLYTTEKTEKLTAEDVRAGRCTAEELVSQLTVEEMATLCVGIRRRVDTVAGDSSEEVPGAAGETSSVLKKSRGIRNLILSDGPAGLRLLPVFRTDPEGNLLPDDADQQVPEENVTTWYQYCTAIPIAWNLAQSWNLELLEQIGSMVGEEMEEFGVDLWLAPALNIHRNPLCGRNFEYYSEDPLISGKAAAAITRGVQSHAGKGTTIKHFAANSQEDNRFFTSAHVSERAIREIYLRGFEIAVKESQPMAIMSSYNLLNGIHTANRHDLLQAVARDEWGFQGFIMTDWFTSQRVPEFTGTGNAYPVSASTGCIHAGNDVQMPGCQGNVDDIVRAVQSGEELDGYRISLADLQFCAANLIRVILRSEK